MDKNDYLAHKTDDREQALEEHLNNTAKLSEQFAAVFGKGEMGRMAGYLHDWGKGSEAFQNRIRHPESTAKCDHSTAGALEAFQRGQPGIAMCIMGHHGGLPNLGSNVDTSEDGTVQARLKKAKEGRIPDCSQWKEICSLPDFGKVSKMNPQQSAFERYMEIKMLHSALVDADYLDTESFTAQGTVPRGGCDTLAQLKDRLESYIENQKWLEPQEGINEMRTEILETAASKGKEWQRGIYTLTVPTGGGKTISSLRYGLHHAVEHGLDRIIYVIPYMNIIEQTAGKFREILGDENVLEHHSNVIYEEEDEGQNKLRLATENWMMPIVVTTAVCFFESLFHNKPSKCRKIHNIANSVIIYDEVQMLPVSYWIPCIHVIEELSASYRTTQILCTATQPAVTFSPQTKVLEITQQTEKYYEKCKRATFRDAGELTLEEVAKKIDASEQILCIVNTKRKAKKIYDMLSDKEAAFHLTTMMIPEHREEMLLAIRKKLEEGYPCKVIATCLVEAGVDLDFAHVMRELAGLDSILQAAGRCNRNGKRSREESVTEIFATEGRMPDSIRQQVDAARYIMGKYKQWDSLEAIEAYFRFWRELRGKENLDIKNVMEKVDRYACRDIAEAFHLIENDTYTIYIPWHEKGKELIDALRKGEKSKELFRRLGRYGVNVFEPHYREFLRLGNIELVQGLAVLNNMELYHEETGLEFQAEEGIAIFC